MALITRANLKTLIGISSSVTTYDSQLDLCVSAAEAAVRSYLRRGYARAAFASWPESSSDVFFLSGSGRNELCLPFLPVTTITSVKLDTGGFYGKASGSFGSGTALTEGTDFVLDYNDDDAVSASGILFRLSGTPPSATSFHAWADLPASRRSTLAARMLPVWPRVAGCVRVEATCGFASVPADISTACMMLAQSIRLMAVRGGYIASSESLGSYSTSILANSPVMGDARSMLARYRFPVF